MLEVVPLVAIIKSALNRQMWQMKDHFPLLPRTCWKEEIIYNILQNVDF